ncbi:MAG: hypothetical protein HW421_3291 [Ignavibacteria bacterium]|nr:hypothetical protein [Ignavibacteria bacterium]
MVLIHPHALQRIEKRGATQKEVIDTVLYGDEIDGKYVRSGFKKIFKYDDFWNDK